MDGFRFDVPSCELRPDDLFTLDVTLRRRWWQFWKPRQWTERRAFHVLGR